ncbi:aminodeoxychorismate synthase, component I [Rhodobacteraceae bacterium WD3A24]|nr:aminodeoxychorismate synthase, component I [Rhodobacteraceae bacterium WD3A24]
MILVEDGPRGRPALFGPPARVIRADRPEEVAPALEAMARARAAGRWLAGHAAYEAGLALEPRLAPLMPAARPGPLLHFAVCDAPQDAASTLARAAECAGEADLDAPVPDWDAARHARAFARVQDYIAAGETYQINLTFPLASRWSGSPLGLLGALRATQPVAHGALIELPDAPVLLSRSPELFFRTEAGGRIETRPMKGTAPRHPDPARDAALHRELAESDKNRAENLMIVDLLRNDIGRLCEIGSVRVPELYRIARFATVHQMTSRVTGQLRAGVDIPEIFAALFPCGSVTGAPKIRSMEIIAELETAPRGPYCGAIGWMGPDGTAAFNVAIRTLSLHADGAATLNVGGGVVHDSTAREEYEEALWKARFTNLWPS